MVKSKFNVNMISGIFLLGICSILFFWIIPVFVESGPAALMPRLTVLWTAAFSLWLFWIGFQERGLGHQKEEEAPMIDKMDLGTGESVTVIILMLIWGVHIFLLPYLGYYVGSGLAMAASMLLLGKRSFKNLAAWTLGSLGVLYFLFEKVLQLRLPKGLLVDKILFTIFSAGQG